MIEGGWMCGAVRLSAPGPAARNLECHCKDFRRANSLDNPGDIPKHHNFHADPEES